MLGWAQLASLPPDAECQCANGNVARISGKPLQIVSISPVGNETSNVTTDLLGTRTLYHRVSVVSDMPGGYRTETIFEATQAFCAQVCYAPKEVLERIKEYAKYLLINT